MNKKIIRRDAAVSGRKVRCRLGEMVGDFEIVELAGMCDGKALWIGRCPNGHSRYFRATYFSKKRKPSCPRCRGVKDRGTSSYHERAIWWVDEI